MNKTTATIVRRTLQGQRTTEMVHDLLRAHVRPGDAVIDATAGQGHDTLCLARLTHRVWALDIQPAALQATRQRLVENLGTEVSKKITLIQGNHAEILASLATTMPPASVQAVVFNLGYLPKGNKEIRTTAETTIEALNTVPALLHPDRGLLLVSCYRGHEGGLEEARAVHNWLLARGASSWKIDKYTASVTNPRNPPPILYAATRNAAASVSVEPVSLFKMIQTTTQNIRKRFTDSLTPRPAK